MRRLPRLCVFAWLVSSGAAVAAGPTTRPLALFPVLADGKWGYIDLTGKWVIPPRFDAVGQSTGSFVAGAPAPVVREGKWVYINRKGQTVVTVPGRAARRGAGRPLRKGRRPEGDAELTIQHAGPFREGLAVIMAGRIRMGDIGRMRYGYLDRQGKWMAPPHLAGARAFADGLGAVREGRTWRYIDKAGNTVFDQVEIATDFADGVAVVRRKGVWERIDKTGRTLVSYGVYEQFRPFSDGLALVRRNRKWGYVDPKGKMVIALQFDIAEPFACGVALVWRGGYDRAKRQMVGKYQVIDPQGRPISKLEFASAYSASEGLVPVQYEGKWGYLAATGKWAIRPQFQSAQNFSEGLAAVRVEGKWVYIDKTGKVKLRPPITFGGPFRLGLARIKLGQADGYLNRRGKVVRTWSRPVPLWHEG